MKHWFQCMKTGRIVDWPTAYTQSLKLFRQKIKLSELQERSDRQKNLTNKEK